MSLPIICAMTGRLVGFSVIERRICFVEIGSGMDAKILRVINVRAAVTGHEAPKGQVGDVLHRREREDRLRLREERAER
jgi:hypothetical protein